MIAQRDSEIVVGLGKIRLDLDCPSAGRHRRAKAAQIGQGDRQIVMGRRQGRFQFDRLVERRHRVAGPGP